MASRREVLALLAASLAASAAHGQRRIPQGTLARVIIDNDFAGDPDSLVALAHHLLSPVTRATLITTTAIDPKLSSPALAETSAIVGRDIALELIRRLKPAIRPPVVAGPESRGAGAARDDAARAIVTEALRQDELPLYFCSGGPLTNLAAALRLQPSIADRMTVIWIGGGSYPEGGWEYNLSVDVEAARTVIEGSQIPLWQVPQDAYRQMAFPISEMTDRLQPLSPFGAWLYDRFTSPPSFVKIGGAWPMGDSPPTLFTTIGSDSSRHVTRPARRILDDLRYGAELPARPIRVYESIDSRLALEDFLSLLRLHARR
ncbi:MAG: hypothetical protein RLZZ200_1025 [Pseudomonadota bacterium]|jgi:hypothetical protein